MKTMRTLPLLLLGILLGISLALPNGAQAQAARIFLDGSFGDWDNLDPAHIDASGDAPASGVDFTRLWIEVGPGDSEAAGRCERL